MGKIRRQLLMVQDLDERTRTLMSLFCMRWWRKTGGDSCRLTWHLLVAPRIWTVWEMETVDEILSGCFVPPLGMDTAFVELLLFLMRPGSIKPLETFTEDAFRSGWRKMNVYILA